MKSILVNLLVILLGTVEVTRTVPIDEKNGFRESLGNVESEYATKLKGFKPARWTYLVGKSDATWAKYIEEYKNLNTYQKAVKPDLIEECKSASRDDPESVNPPNPEGVPDPENPRKCEMVKQMRYFDNDVDLKQMEDLKRSMIDRYFNTKIKEYGGEKELKISDINAVIGSSNNFTELEYYYNALRKAADTNKDDFVKMATISNKGKQNDDSAKTTPDHWAHQFGDDDILTKMEEMAGKMKALYELIYSYARLKLSEKYKGKIKKYGMIPQFITGNILGSSWENLYETLKFEPEESLTQAMVDKKFTVDQMFDKAFELIGDSKFNIKQDKIKKNSVLESNDNMDCWPFTDDLFDEDDYRMKLCAAVREESLEELFSLVSEIHYYFLYQGKSALLKSPASPGLLKGYAGAVSLAGMSPANLKKLELITDIKNIKANNFLLKQFLKSLPKFMHAMAIETWRKDYYSSEKLDVVDNKKLWDKFSEYLGFSKPKDVEGKFDAGLVLDVLADEPLYGSAIGEILKYDIKSKICKSKSDYTCELDTTKLETDVSSHLAIGFGKTLTEILTDMKIEDFKNCKQLMDESIPFQIELNRQLEGGCKKADCNAFAGDELAKYDVDYKNNMNEMVEKDWKYNTDINEANQAASIQGSLKYAEWAKEEGLKYQDFDTDLITNSKHKRLIERISFLGYSATDDKELEKFMNAVSNMSTLYSTAKICPYKKQTCNLKTEGLELSRDLEPLMDSSDNYDELAYTWLAWRDVTGPHMRQDYLVYLEQGQKIADANNVNNLADVWLFEYEDEDFRKYSESLWEQLEPFYKNFHAYVRHKLNEKYPKRFDPDGPIPAHILGNMWAQDWSALYEDVVPYKGKMDYSITEGLKKKFKKPEDMFDEAEGFFKSVGLFEMTASFKKNSVFVKPDDKEMVCHASAWDFFKKDDFRIKMCTQLNADHFETVHHEMGHIEYYMAYENLEGPFRTGANPGFHEAVGDTIALSVMNPKHLKTSGLLPEDGDYSLTDKENKINYLMKQALTKLPLLPFAFIVDLWRWQLFNKTTSTKEMNRAWWNLREKYQGLIPPFRRNENDLDPAAKYHVSNNVPYIRYFIAGMLQFQLHNTLCEKQKDVVECIMTDVDGSGERLKKMLKLGASEHWRNILGKFVKNEFTKDELTAEIDATSVTKYFKDLDDYISDYLKEKGIEPGWKSTIDSFFKEPEYNTSQIPVIIGGLLGGIVVIIIALFIYKRVKGRS